MLINVDNVVNHFIIHFELVDKVILVCPVLPSRYCSSLATYNVDEKFKFKVSLQKFNKKFPFKIYDIKAIINRPSNLKLIEKITNKFSEKLFIEFFAKLLQKNEMKILKIFNGEKKP